MDVAPCFDFWSHGMGTKIALRKNQAPFTPKAFVERLPNDFTLSLPNQVLNATLVKNQGSKRQDDIN